MEMTTTTAAKAAGVTVATIRTWCRLNVIAAAKVAGRWIVDSASLLRRLQIGSSPRKTITLYKVCGHVVATPVLGEGATYERVDTCKPCASANAMETAQQRRRDQDTARAARRSRWQNRRCECASGRYGGVCTC